jgi:hypothetical protein
VHPNQHMLLAGQVPAIPGFGSGGQVPLRFLHLARHKLQAQRLAREAWRAVAGATGSNNNRSGHLLVLPSSSHQHHHHQHHQHQQHQHQHQSSKPKRDYESIAGTGSEGSAGTIAKAPVDSADLLLRAADVGAKQQQQQQHGSEVSDTPGVQQQQSEQLHAPPSPSSATAPTAPAAAAAATAFPLTSIEVAASMPPPLPPPLPQQVRAKVSLLLMPPRLLAPSVKSDPSATRNKASNKRRRPNSLFADTLLDD